MASAAAIGSALFAAVLLTAGPAADPAGPRVVQPGAPGQPGRTLSRDELLSFSPPAHMRADSRFMQRMILHHEQALRMTALVPGRGVGPEVTLLATRIEVSQRDEIAQIRRWLADHGEEAPSSAAGHAGHGDMPGMLTDGQLDRLGRARGAEFDRTFLEFMIHHHEGALTMVRELYATGGGLEPATDRFAREVNAGQSIEIRRMRSMLADLR